MGNRVERLRGYALGSSEMHDQCHFLSRLEQGFVVTFYQLFELQ
jgi:hypothetical protein